MNMKDRYQNIYIFPMYVFLCMYSSKFCYSISNITSSRSLSTQQTLDSPSQVFELGFFTPNNSSYQYIGIWYKQISPHQVVWVANRENPLLANDSNPSFVIGSGGNIEILDGKNSSIWSTNIQVKSNGSIAVLLDNGNLVVKDAESGQELWQSFQHLSDTFLPGSVVGFNLKTGENYNITSWKTENDPSIGMFTAGLSRQRPTQAFIWSTKSVPHWRSGPWDKSRFSGLPRMSSFLGSPLNVIEDTEKGTTYIYANWYNDSTVGNLFLSPGGILQTRLRDKDGDWYSNSSPQICDLYSLCGPFGVCKSYESPICECLKGFVPKTNDEWSRGNWSGGCVRRSPLLTCNTRNSSVVSKEGKSDWFRKIENAKVPDFYELVELGFSGSGESCQKWCADNCSCSAYAYIGGIGCLVWSVELVDIQVFSSGGEDLVIQLAHEELVGEQSHGKIIIGLVVICACLIIAAVIFGFRRWIIRHRGKERGKQIDPNWRDQNSSDDHQFHELPIFDFDTILVATDHFSPNNKLGQGGFGPVYRGKMEDGKEIAVKRLSSTSDQGSEEFKNEMILISKLQHRNLVKLFGYCIEKEEKLLIYEFMPNKSLDYFIFDSTRRAQLDWATRFNIIIGVAKGLVYLHRDSSLRVIHRDLKVSNILLDEKMCPKISDFGLARIFQETLDLANTHRVVGTLGYISPEYAMGGIFSEKSDVFSFGVLLLEILIGQKNNNFRYAGQQSSLIAYAWKLWNESRELDFVDDQLGGSYCASEATRCVQVALLCIQDHTSDRPSMPEVVFMLSNETNRPKPKQPFLTYQATPKINAQVQPKSGTVNDQATISLIEGR